MEVALRKLAAKEASEKYGVEIEDREMSMLTANEMSQVEEPKKTNKQSNDNEELADD